jgi:histidinol phosphatase-like PHP family hydrolase
MIPMGDIDLLEEIRLNNETGVVGYHHPERTRVRRVYSAKVDGRKSGVTVAVYQGKGAEEVSPFVHPDIYVLIRSRRNGARILRII